MREVQEVASFLQDAFLHQRGEVLETIWYGLVLFPTLVSAFTSYFTFQDAEEENPQVQLPMLDTSVQSNWSAAVKNEYI